MTLVLEDEFLGVPVGDGYTIRKKISEGGMGALYLAIHDEVLSRRKAIKVLLPEIAARPDLIARFKAEALAAASIHHPNIVDVDGFGRLPSGALYIKMEFLDGVDLRTWAHRRHDGMVPSDEALQVLAQVVAGLDQAHRQGIIHRDLKPENIFIAPTDDNALRAKVLDFGIAKVRNGPARTIGGAGGMGTPGYWSPEQAVDPSTTDARADIYALGVIVYELMTSTLPPPGIERAPQLPAAIPVGWWPVLRAALSVDRGERPASVRDFLNGLIVGLEDGHKLAEAVAPGLFRHAATDDSTIKHPSPLPSVPGVTSEPPRLTTLGAAAGARVGATAAPQRRSVALVAGVAVAVAVVGIVLVLAVASKGHDKSTSDAPGSSATPAAIDARSSSAVPVAIDAMPDAMMSPDAAPDASPDAATPPPTLDAGTTPHPRPRPRAGSGSGPHLGHDVDGIGDL